MDLLDPLDLKECMDPLDPLDLKETPDQLEFKDRLGLKV